MTCARLLAVLLAACALVASAWIVIPVDSVGAPDLTYTESVPAPLATPKYATASDPTAGARTAAADAEAHAAVPRLWLGSPVAR